MVVPGGTVVVSVVRTIVLGGRDGGGQGTVVNRVVNEIMYCSVHYYHVYCRGGDTALLKYIQPC